MTSTFERLQARAPAKINLGLEVVGRRSDGYHCIVTILQAIDLCDAFVWEPTGEPFRYTGADGVPEHSDLVVRALREGDVSGWTGTLRLDKRIPPAAGLGGGSSDAALALRLALPDADDALLGACAGNLGSDVPFFLRGGTALARGTGTELSTLPTPACWVVLVTPSLSLPDKTRKLYEGLTPEDFSAGARVELLSEHLEEAVSMRAPNAFERQMRAIEPVERAWAALAEAAGGPVNLSGAGPTVYALFHGERAARRAAVGVAPDVGAVHVARTLSAGFDAQAIGALAAAVRGRVRSL